MPISKSVIELQDKSRINIKDKADFVPEGFFVICDESLSEYTGASVGCIFINLKDVINTKYHLDSSRLNGCCGYDGCDGINVVCKNGHEIGIENSDCWMPHSFIVEKDLVDWSN
ncbi:hypothetical protein [Bacillus rhizoplanae]|uniref:hypothetical protein n=1 Tax=Bacillus rhizoplanae TaxID=2880966 RepID=UPI003D250C8C